MLKNKILLTTLSCFSAFLFVSCSTSKAVQPDTNTLTDPNQQNLKVVRDAMDASVGLSFKLSNSSIGSGVIFKITDENDKAIEERPKDDGPDKLILYILTNAHVVNDYYRVLGTSDAGSMHIIFTKNDLNADDFSEAGTYATDGELLGLDPATDLAAVKTKVSLSHLKKHTNRGINTINLFPSKGSYDRTAPKVGTDTFAIGNPLSLQNVLNYTEGRVAAVHKGYVTSEAPINPGNSGGGLFDLYTGRLIGVNTFAKIKDNEGLPVEGNFYSIGIDYILNSIGEIYTRYTNASTSGEKKPILIKRLNANTLASVVSSDTSQFKYTVDPSNVTVAGQTIYRNVLVFIKPETHSTTEITISGDNTTHKTKNGNISALKQSDIFTSIICPYDIPELSLRKGDVIELTTSFDLEFYLHYFDTSRFDTLEINGYYSVVTSYGFFEEITDYVETVFTITIR